MKKKYILIFLLVLTFFNIQAIDKNYQKKLKSLLDFSVPIIISEELKKLDQEEIIILDTRTEEEYNVSHIKNAIWVGYKEFNIEKIKYIPKKSKIVVYCSVGYRSEKIGEKLIEAGYTNVYNLYGGIFEWINLNYEIFDEQAKTNKIHGFSKNWSKWLKKAVIVY